MPGGPRPPGCACWREVCPRAASDMRFASGSGESQPSTGGGDGADGNQDRRQRARSPRSRAGGREGLGEQPTTATSWKPRKTFTRRKETSSRLVTRGLRAHSRARRAVPVPADSPQGRSVGRGTTGAQAGRARGQITCPPRRPGPGRWPARADLPGYEPPGHAQASWASARRPKWPVRNPASASASSPASHHVLPGEGLTRLPRRVPRVGDEWPQRADTLAISALSWSVLNHFVRRKSPGCHARRPVAFGRQ